MSTHAGTDEHGTPGAHGVAPEAVNASIRYAMFSVFALEEALPVKFQAQAPGRYTVTVRHAPEARGH